MKTPANILIVDDVPTNLDVVSKILAPLGHTLATVTNGKRALKQLQRYQPDLILLDIQMPGMDGFEVCEQIKAIPGAAHIPIIFLTVQSDANSIAKAFELGAVDYICKPFQDIELVARVKTHLKLQSMNQVLEQQVAQRTQALEHLNQSLEAQIKERTHALRENEERLRLAMQAANQGFFDINLRADTAITSPEYALMLGYDPAHFHETPEAWRSRLHPEDKELTHQAYRAYATGETQRYRAEFRLRTQSGHWKWILSMGQFIEWDDAGVPTRFLGVHTDIDEYKLVDSQLQIQNTLLEKVAQGLSLNDMLNTLVTNVEKYLDSALGAILFLDDTDHLRHGVAPNLPTDYNQVLDGIGIGEGVGSCGTAAVRQETVVVADIATDPLWASDQARPLKELALSHGLKACWSTPILAASGTVLGTFAIYYRAVRSPSRHELNFITQMAHIAGIAIERQRADEQLRRSESVLLEAQHIAHMGHWEIELLSQTFHWSPALIHLFGLDSVDSLPDYDECRQMVPAEDRDRVDKLIEQVIISGQPFTAEYRFLHPDGTLRYHECRGQVDQTATSQTQRLFGTIIDITERKTAELALQNLVVGTASTTGPDFFPALVEHIADALQVTYASVSKRVTTSHLDLLAFWADGTLQPSFSYAIGSPGQTPCHEILHQGQVLCDQSVAHDFPDDDFLVSLGITSYLGVALRDRHNTTLGTLCVFDTKPIQNLPRAEQILQIFAARAAAELERQQAEQQLVASENKFRSIFHHAAIGIVHSSLGSNHQSLQSGSSGSQILACNPRFCQMLGYTSAELIGVNIAAITHPDDQAVPEFPRLIAGEISHFSMEKRYIRKDGTMLWAQTTVALQHDGHDRLSNSVAVIQDISDRKRLEFERQKTEAALQNLIIGTASTTGEDFFPALVHHIAAALEVTHVLVTEQPPDYTDLRTLAFWADGALQPTVTYPIAGSPCDQTMQLGSFYCQQQLKQHFPHASVLENVAVDSYLGIALRDAQGNVLGTLYILHVTQLPEPQQAEQILRVFAARASAELERQRAAVALQLSEARARASFDQVAMGVAESDIQTGRLLRVNEHFCALMGYTRDQLTAMTMAAITHPDDVSSSLENIQKLSQGDQRDFTIEKRYIRKDGSHFWSQTTATLVQLPDGNAQYCLGMIWDITARKQAEQALQNLIAGTAATTGEDFFPALVSHMATTLNVSYAMVSELTGDQLKTIAFWANGVMQQSLAYPVAKTPCEKTLETGRFYCEHDVRELFPEDPDLVDMDADSYLGIALRDAEGNAIGNLCILHQQAIDNPHEAEQIMQVFAARATAELERQQAQTELEALNAALETKVEERTAELATSRAYYQGIIADQTELICRFLPDSTLTFVNKAYCDFYQTSPEDLMGRRFILMLPKSAQRSRLDNINGLSIEQPVAIHEHPVWAPDGSLRWQQWSDRALFDTHGNFIEYQAVGRDITERKQAEQALENLIEGTAATTGQDFFPALVRHISEALGIAYVFVSTKVSPDEMTMLAFWGDGTWQSTQTYDPGPVPCQRILEQGRFYCEQSIQEIYPDNALLKELNVQSYLGVAVCNSQGETIGSLCIFDPGVLPNPQRAEQILRVFAARAGAELERQWASTALEHLNQSLEIKVAERTAELQEREVHLRASEQRYISLAAAVPVGIFRHDAAGNCVYVNQRACEITGLSHAILMGDQWQDAIHSEDRDRVTATWIQAFQTQTPFQLEYRFQRPDGTVRWVYTQAVVEQDIDGQMIGSVGTLTDISDRKQAEIALQNLVAGTAATTGQDFFPALVEHIAAALRVDCAFVAEKVDDHMHMLAFWQQDSLQPPVSYPLHSPPCDQILQTGYYACKNGFSQAFPENLVSYYGIVESYLGIALNDSQGNIIGTLCIFDAHPMPDLKQADSVLQVFAARAAAELERQRATHALRHLNQDLEAKVVERTKALTMTQAAVDLAADDVFLICPDGSFYYVNEAACASLEYSQDELRSLGVLDIAPEFSPEHWVDFWQTSKQKRSFTLETPHRAKDGRIFPVEISAKYLNFDGEEYIFAFVRDISDRKRTEAQIARYTTQLEDSNRELESFAYSVSHDLRAPLRAIDGFSKALLEDYGDTFDQMATGYFERIRRNIARMSLLIDDLLSLSRVSRAELRPTNVNLSQLVQELTHDLQESTPERSVDVIIAPDVTVVADTTLMRVMLTNLLQNAWKFTSHHTTAHIEFGTHITPGQPITYFIKDDGAGFDMHYIHKLFGVFQRLHTEHEFPGTGIGLATVQRIIHRHGGRVWAEAAIEQGATFYFTVPQPAAATDVTSP